MLKICYSSSLVIMLTINMIFTVDLSQDGATALHVASQEGHNQVVELLLQAGASVDQKAKVRWGVSYSAFMSSRDYKPCLYPLVVSKS